MKNIPQDEFQKRRIQRRKKIRRRRTVIGILVFICLSVAVFIALSLTVLFPVKQIVVSGESRYTYDQIISASGITEENNIFTFSSEKAMQRIRKNLPYIGEMTIERKLPGTVDIKIKSEQTEFACYNINGRFYAVSKDHFVLNYYSQPPQSLFVINHDEAECVIGEKVVYKNKKTKEATFVLIDELVNNGIKINNVKVPNSTSLSATVEERFIVSFGGVTDIESKVAHLAGMIEKISPSETGRIDLSMWTVKNSEGIFIPGDIIIDSYEQSEDLQFQVETNENSEENVDNEASQ